MPAGSLGHMYGLFLTSQGLSELPAPTLSKEMASDDAYLQLRIRYTHDLWHVIAGLPITMAGEAVARGLTNKSVADDLGISVGTVKTYVKNAMGKIGARDRTQLAVMAMAYGLIDPMA